MSDNIDRPVIGPTPKLIISQKGDDLYKSIKAALDILKRCEAYGHTYVQHNGIIVSVTLESTLLSVEAEFGDKLRAERIVTEHYQR